MYIHGVNGGFVFCMFWTVCRKTPFKNSVCEIMWEQVGDNVFVSNNVKDLVPVWLWNCYIDIIYIIYIYIHKYIQFGCFEVWKHITHSSICSMLLYAWIYVTIFRVQIVLFREGCSNTWNDTILRGAVPISYLKEVPFLGIPLKHRYPFSIAAKRHQLTKMRTTVVRQCMIIHVHIPVYIMVCLYIHLWL